MNELKGESEKEACVKTKGESAVKANARAKMPSRKTRNPSSSSSSSTVGSSPLDGSSLSRHQRNLAEKQRRDKLNSYINELANLVPMVAGSTKKLDKTSVLRLSAAHLRLYHSCLNPKNLKKIISWRPNLFEEKHLNELLKAINGFLLVTTTTAKIIFTSKYVENYLGHQDIEMIGHSLFNFIHPDDHSYVRGELKKLAVSFHQDENSAPTRTVFCARMRERSQPRSEILNYQLMRFNCTYSVETNIVQTNTKRIFSSRQAKSPVSDLVNGMMKYYVQPVNVNPFDELSITEAFQEEYVTRHGLSGEILYADHRISTITGHLPHEVIGMLAYDYIFQEDVPVAQFAQKLMFSSSDGRGAIVYRLKSRDSTAIYLKTFGQLQYDKSSTKVSHFICVNKLLSEEDGKEELQKFNDRYSPRINDFFAFAQNDPLALNSGQACQMIENGPLQTKNGPTNSSTLTSLQVVCGQVENMLPSLSSSVACPPRDTLNSNYPVYLKTETLRVLSNAPVCANNTDPCMTQLNNGFEVLQTNNVLPEAKLHIVSKTVMNCPEIKCSENNMHNTEVTVQHRNGNDYSTVIPRKRTADMLLNCKTDNPVVSSHSKYMKNNCGILQCDVSCIKQPKVNGNILEVQPDEAHGAEFGNSEWLNYFGNSTLTNTDKLQISASCVSQNSYSNGKNIMWRNISDSSCSGDDQITMLSPGKKIGTELFDSSNSGKGWLEGALQDLYPET